MAAGCTCITCGQVGLCFRASAAGSRDLGKCRSLIRQRKKPVVRHLRRNPARNIANAYRRGATWRIATRNAQICKIATLFASLKYAAGAAGAAVRGKELLGYAAWVVRFPVERADRRIRDSNSDVDRHHKISVIYTGCTPAVSPVDRIVRAI